MNLLPSENDTPSSPAEGILVARQPTDWLKIKNKKPSPSELITFSCPYKLRKTTQFRFDNKDWTIGDIVSLSKPKSKKTIYAQILELFENDLCEKRAKIMWLAPKSNTEVSNASNKNSHNCFNPNSFVHVTIDKRLVPIHCLTFVTNVPNQYEYKKNIGTDYLVNTQIISHAERYAESDEEEGHKSKSKVRRLLNK